MRRGCSWQGLTPIHPPTHSKSVGHHKPGEDKNGDGYHIHFDEDDEGDQDGDEVPNKLHRAASLGIACCSAPPFFAQKYPGRHFSAPK